MVERCPKNKNPSCGIQPVFNPFIHFNRRETGSNDILKQRQKGVGQDLKRQSQTALLIRLYFSFKSILVLIVSETWVQQGVFKI